MNEGFPPQLNMPVQSFGPETAIFPGTPLSQIRGFPNATSPGPNPAATGDVVRQPSPLMVPQPFQPPEALSMTGDGFNGPESFALPQVCVGSGQLCDVGGNER
jgi:hypothetical protein